MQVESTSKPMVTVDEVEQIQRKKVATIIGRVFKLSAASVSCCNFNGKAVPLGFSVRVCMQISG